MEGSEDWFTRAMQMQTQTQIEMWASLHVQRKWKEREIRKRSKSIFPRWPTMIALLPIHTCGKRTHYKYWLKKMKMFLLLGLTLAFAFAFALGGSHD